MDIMFDVLANDAGLFSTIQELFTPIIDFFRRFGELGLFIYSIIETITPLAGVEIILVPLILTSEFPWWFITFILVSANTIGAIIVYFFMAKEDNKLYNRIVSKKNQEKAKQMFDRYGVWAIFIFAMTPLPFFVIIFTAAVAKMKFWPYIFAAFFSRSVRFYITSYFVHLGGSNVNTGEIILWLAVIGVGAALVFMFIQRKILAYFEKKMEQPNNKS